MKNEKHAYASNTRQPVFHFSILIFHFLFFIFLPLTASAYSFQKAAPSGQMLYYNITGDATVTVVSPSAHWGQHPKPEGMLVIPATVDNDGVTYHVTAIGQEAFGLCTDLTGVVVPEGVVSIGSFAFYNCTSLDSIQLPSTLDEIRSQAFYGTSYVLDEANCDSNGLLYIGNYLISCRSNIDSIITIRDSTIGLGAMSMYYNQSIKMVYLPSTLRFIGGLAFSKSENLDTVQLSTSQPPSVIDDSFDTTRDVPITIKVPRGTADTYRSHPVWRKYNIVEYGEAVDPVDPVDTTNHDDPPVDPTDPSNPNDDIDVWTDASGLVIHVSVGAEIYVFDIDAHVLFHTVATENVIRVPLNNSGVYIVRREDTPFPETVVFSKR